MDGKRRRLQHVALFCISLLLVGTFLSFFIAPHIKDARTRRTLGLPDDAFVTDTARSTWVYINEKGEATLFGDRMIGVKTLYIPSAVNGIALEKILYVYNKPQGVEVVVFPSTLDISSSIYYFRKWEDLKILVFEEDMQVLEGGAVLDFPALEAIYLPRSIKKIHSSFLKQENITIYYAGTEEEWRALGTGAEKLAKNHTVVFETPYVPEN